jgi:hypothetical protein
MRPITAEEWELLSFFEVEPQLTDPGDPWDFNTALYVIDTAEWRVEFSVSPWHRDFTLEIDSSRGRFFEFTGLDVDDIRVSPDDKDELEIVLSPRHKMTLRIRPTLQIRQRIAVNPDP